MNFEELNERAYQSQYSLVKKMGENIFEGKLQNEKFIQYLITYLEPHIEEVANKVIANNGEMVEKTIIVNDIIETYERTDYIVNTYKDRFFISKDPVSVMLGRLIGYAERAYKYKLPAFYIQISDSASYHSATCVKYFIKIIMSYNTYFDYQKNIFAPLASED